KRILMLLTEQNCKYLHGEEKTLENLFSLKNRISLLIERHPKLGHVVNLGKLATIAGSTQLMIQLLSLISGIFVIRLLPTEEYALYTLANTMLGTMMILADSGIAAGVTAQGGKVWKNKQKLGSVLSTGFHLRKKFALV